MCMYIYIYIYTYVFTWFSGGTEDMKPICSSVRSNSKARRFSLHTYIT